MNNQQQLGERIGRAIARDTLANELDHGWAGLTAEDSDQLIAAGIEPHSERWRVAEGAARQAYFAALDTDVSNFG